MSRLLPDIENGDPTPRSVAVAWFSRQRSGQMTDAERAALTEWLGEDRAHLHAYRAVRAAWADLGVVRAHPRMMTLREDAAPAYGRRLALGALAASAAVLVGAGGWMWQSGPRPLGDHTFATALGERVTITLPDGSELTLNTDTVVRTRADASRRMVYLDKGQAYFKVAKDRRHPFVVTAGGRTITALGTAFDVRLDQGVFKVTLVEGKVRVEAAAPGGAGKARAVASLPRSQVQATEMIAGSQLVAPDGGEWRLVRANTAIETSWTHGQLLFDNTPLQDVVAELNRYSTTKMVVPSEDLRNTLISGNFKPGDVDGFVFALEKFGLARGVSSREGGIELRPLS